MINELRKQYEEKFGSRPFNVEKDGRVYSYRLGRYLKGEKMKKGYVRYKIDGKRIMGHRLVAEMFIPNPKNKPFVNHKNGKKDDNRVENLEWCTAKENDKHAWATGLKKARKGVEHHKAKLNEKQVRVIKHMLTFKNRMTYREIAKIFGVYESLVGKICRGELWKHIIV